MEHNKPKTEKPLIYSVEDDPAIQELFTYSLENEFDCRCFHDGTDFYDALKTRLPELVLLDIMLPGEDGYTILTQLKENPVTKHIPVIMVSAKGEEPAKVKGLNAGADDYIAKPFGVLELVARIKANLRKYTTAHGSASYKDISINDAKHEITVNGKVLQITRKEYNLLAMLCEHAETVQEREIIFSKVWGEAFIGETRTLDIHIKELRKKLAAADSGAEIKTVRGVGYMLI